MKRLRWFLPLLAFWIAAGQATQSNQPVGWKTIFSDDFEDGIADGWSVSVWQDGAGWEVLKDGANYVFSGKGHTTAHLTAGRWTDFRFKACVKLIRGSLFFNYRTSGCERYFLNFSSGSLGLSRSLSCSSHPTLLTVPSAVAAGRWYTVEMVGIGASLKFYVDGMQALSYADPTPLLFGGAGLEANPDSQVYIDDVEISGPPVPVGIEGLAWVKTGGPPGGVGYDVRVRPDNPDIMFVTDTFSGVSVSEDGGRSWHSSNAGIVARAGTTGESIPIFSLTVDPNNNNVIWAGTQNVRGIYRSTDGGKTWVQRDKGIKERSGITFRGFTVDPRDSRVVYAGAELSSFVWAGESRLCWTGFDMTKGVVYKTTDGGDSWTEIWRGDNLARYIWIDPRDSRVLYVSTGIFDRAPADCTAGSSGGIGILKSIDAGRTWRVLNQANGLTTLVFGSLFMHPLNPDILMAGGGGPHVVPDGGVYLTTDGGATWTRTLNSGMENITSVEFSVSDPNIAYAAGEGAIYRSEDGGRTWTRVNGPPYGPPGIRAGVPIDIQVDPRNPNRLFINNYKGGNFLSEDGGWSWATASRGYTGAQMHRVVVDPRDPRRVFATGRSGVYRSLDGGDHWEGVNYFPAWFGEYGWLALDPTDTQRLLASPENEGALMLSVDSGNHWDLAFRHPGVSTAHYRDGQGFLSIAFAPSNPQVVYAGMIRNRRSIDEGWRDPSFGVFRSTDGGRTWREANDANTAARNITALAVHPQDENVVYAATPANGVFRSTDGGRSWEARNLGLGLLDVRSLALDPFNPSVIYAGLGGGGLFKSINAGGVWRPATSGMDPVATVLDIVVDPANPRVVYAADLHSGVYRSEDGGNLWVQINKGLSTRAVKGLAISSDGGTLYAATDGEGVFRLDIKSGGESTLAGVSAASFIRDAALAPESIASLFGTELAATTAAAGRTPLPTTLSDASVSVTDVAGVDRWAPLFFVSPAQINCQIPAGSASGMATVRVFRQNRVVARGQVRIEPVAPGLFTANADGKGVPAAVALRVAADGAQTPVDVFRCGAAAGSCAPVPLDLGADIDQVILVLFGTGIRGASSLSAVTARIGGVDAPVLYAGSQGQYAGLDQVNVRIPRELKGRGEVDVALTADGRSANLVKLLFR